MRSGVLTGLKGRTKHLIHLAGVSLILLSLVFIACDLVRHWPALAAWRPRPLDLAGLAGLAALYGGILYLLAENWHRIVGLYGPEVRRRTYRSFTSTQIARYLPGNFAHLLGRVVLLRGRALSDAQLGFATVVELAMTPLAAGVALLICLSGLPAAGVPDHLDIVHRVAPALLAVGLLVGVAFGLWAYWTGRHRAVEWAIGMAWVLALGTLFMLALGVIFALILHLLVLNPDLHVTSVTLFLSVMRAAILAWLAGYLTPGAPGGMGPREATLLLLLSTHVDPAALVLAALLFRLVTIVGDLLCFGSGLLLARAAGASSGGPC